MKNIFNKHPNSLGETYLQHFFKSFSFGIKLLMLSTIAFIHALFPWCFENSVSNNIRRLNNILKNRNKSSK